MQKLIDNQFFVPKAAVVPHHKFVFLVTQREQSLIHMKKSASLCLHSERIEMEVCQLRNAPHVRSLTLQAKEMRSTLTQVVTSLQKATLETPYSITHRLKLAQGYKDLGYPDLALGDAYKALILVDEVAEEGEYHEDAFEAAQIDFLAHEMMELSTNTRDTGAIHENDKIVTWAQEFCSRTA